MKQTPEITAVRKKLKEATAELKYILRRKRDAKKQCLSQYTMNIIDEAEAIATGKQMDALMELTDLVSSGLISMEDAMKATNIDTKM
jgi:hypothetical protein